MYLNELSYINNQQNQYKDAQIFIAECLKKMEWDKEDGVVMDFGCGPGKTTFELFQPFFTKVDRIVAIDLLPNMIEFARDNYPHPKIEYHVADAEKRNDMLKWQGQISKLVSIHCLHWLENPELGLQNVYDVLKQGGEAAFFASLKSPIWHSIQMVAADEKWSPYLNGKNHHIPPTQTKEDNLSFYKKITNDIGFTIISCEDIPVVRTLKSYEVCKDYMASLSPCLQYIPEELKGDFKEHLLQYFLSLDIKSVNGIMTYSTSNLTFVLRK